MREIGGQKVCIFSLLKIIVFNKVKILLSVKSVKYLQQITVYSCRKSVNHYRAENPQNRGFTSLEF